MSTHQPSAFTGRRMAIILIAFFGVVITVNMVMARVAIGSFGGTVVDNSYVASQSFNHWLAAARAERSMGWQVVLTREPRGTVLATVQAADGAPLQGAQILAHIRRPVGAAPEQPVTFVTVGPGQLRSGVPLAPGRWQVRATITSAGHQMRVAQDLP